MAERLSLGVRFFCGLSRRVLPRELYLEHGRDVNEAFYDLWAEAQASADSLETWRVMGRELQSLFATVIDERRRRRGERDELLTLRSKPRTSPLIGRPGRPPGQLPSQRPSRRPSRRTPLLGDIRMLDNLLQDTRYALRTMRQSPVFTVVAVLTLALGIGANTAVFSVVNTVLLQPLPYEDPQELTVIWTKFGHDLPQNWLSGPEYLEIREFNALLDELAIVSTDTASMTGGGEPEQLSLGTTSGTFFNVMKVNPQLGRLYTQEDDDTGAKVAVLSDGFWRRRFAGDPGVIGQTLSLDDDPFTIIGVLPAGFVLHHPGVVDPMGMQVYVPMQPTYGTTYGELNRGSHFMLGIGRMKDGVTVAQAQADMDAVAVRMHETSGSYDFEGWGLSIYSLHDDLVENSQGALVVLLGAVGFVLLIACVNVANLQLTRAAAREREIALRTAVGAGSRRIMQQLLTESMVLATLGATVGIALAFWMIKAIALAAPARLPRADEIGLDPNVLLFAGGITLLTALLFGVAPGFFATRTNLVESLKEGGRGASGGRAGQRLRTVLVVAEVALALVLLVGAGLMLRSFNQLLSTDPGYSTESLLTLRTSLPSPKYDTDTAPVFYEELLRRVSAIPSVLSVGAIDALPLSGWGGSGTTVVENSELVDQRTGGGGDHDYAFIEADRRYVTPGLFDTLQVKLLRGRLFTDADNQDGVAVAVVDETLARRFWGDDDPLGQRLAVRWGVDAETGELFWREVVGVIAHVRNRNVAADGREQAYVPYAQRPRTGMHLVVRTDGDPTVVTAAVREAIWAIDPDQPIDDLFTMQERVANNVAQPRFNSLLLGMFAAVALALSALGIYGVISYSVGQRTNEIGVRMALGASERRVRGMVLRQGMVLVAIGLVLGIGAAFGLTRLITNMLYSISPTDPLTYIGVALMLAVVAMFACLIPATRATRVEPVAALRES